MSSLHYPVVDAQRIIHDPELNHSFEKCVAAFSLAEVCEHDKAVKFADMLRCLDYGGVIAEAGARCLYLRTGRDRTGQTPAGSNQMPFIIDRTDWESYLRKYYPNDVA
jgi:hypothetical protein